MQGCFDGVGEGVRGWRVGRVGGGGCMYVPKTGAGWVKRRATVLSESLLLAVCCCRLACIWAEGVCIWGVRVKVRLRLGYVRLELG